jgi:hypothetical protein
MTRTCWLILIPLLCSLGVADAQRGGPSDDDAAVRSAVLDYVEALYEVDPGRIERSVHPELAKRGFGRSREDGSYKEARMSYDELHRLAATWNRAGRVDARTAPKQVIVLDRLDQTATVKLVAQWGVDYMHLAKYDGRWKVVNVLWQSAPQARRS